MARPKKIQDSPRGTIDILDRVEKPATPPRLRIHQDYTQYIVIIDVSDIVPFSMYRVVETVFPKLGLVIKRKFGFLGYKWGYGAITETRDGETAAVLTAPTGLSIYFQEPIDETFLAENASKFADIVAYLKREMDLYRGVTVEQF